MCETLSHNEFCNTLCIVQFNKVESTTISIQLVCISPSSHFEPLPFSTSPTLRRTLIDGWIHHLIMYLPFSLSYFKVNFNRRVDWSMVLDSSYAGTSCPGNLIIPRANQFSTARQVTRSLRVFFWSCWSEYCTRGELQRHRGYNTALVGTRRTRRGPDEEWIQTWRRKSWWRAGDCRAHLGQVKLRFYDGSV